MSETIWKLTTDDVQIMLESEFDGVSLTSLEMHVVKKCVDSGLAEWSDVLRIAIETALEDRKK